MEALLLMMPFLMLLIVLIALPSGTTTKRQQRRLAVIERKIDLVMEHLGVDPEPAMPEVVRALEQGNKIAAVKAYRNATGADLKESKDAVDALAERRGL